VAENYIVIIAASVPLLNVLVKRGKQQYGSGSASHKMSTSGPIMVQKTLTVCSDTQPACERDEEQFKGPGSASHKMSTSGPIMVQKTLTVCSDTQPACEHDEQFKGPGEEGV
jgi:hypothetical protein